MTHNDFTPTLLLVEDQEWTARSIESILRPHGFVVLKSYTGQQCLDVAQRLAPDVLMCALHLPDMTGIDLLKALRGPGLLRSSTPRLITSIGDMTQADRLSAFEAGAWDLIRPPFGSAELSIKLKNWIRAKRDADEDRDNGLIDLPTGVYNFKGLVKRVEEIVSEANRSEYPVSFIVLAPAPRAAAAAEEAPAPTLAQAPLEIESLMASALRSTCRLSDAVGRLVEQEFAVVAPRTDQLGAGILAQRILEAVSLEHPGIELRAGVYSAQRSQRDPVVSFDLLSRATAALRKAQAGEGGATTIQAYELN